jgi:hypothetical protein
MHRFIVIIALAVVAIGCRSVDLTSQHSDPAPKCEIHGTQMHPEWIRVSTGRIEYTRISYLDDAKQRFPHHGGVILSGEREFMQPIDRRVRDFVCPDCTRVYEAYWKEHVPK